MLKPQAVEPAVDPTKIAINNGKAATGDPAAPGVTPATEPGSPNPNAQPKVVDPAINPAAVKVEPTKVYGGGLFNAIKDFLPKEGEEDEVVSIDGFTEEEFTKAKAIIKDETIEKVTDDLLKDFSEEQIQSLKEVYADRFGTIPASTNGDGDGDGDGDPSALLNKKLEDLTPEQLIEEVKKNQRFVSKRLEEAKTLKAELDKLKNDSQGNNGGGDSDLTQFVEELKKNPAQAWSRYKSKFNLPDQELLKASLSSEPEQIIKVWHEQELKPQLEKQFKLEKGEFEIVKEDLYEPGTPSYAFRKATEAKERELDEAVSRTRTSEAQLLEQIKAKQIEDIKYVAETDLGGDLAKAETLFNELNALPMKIANGEAPAEMSPYAIRNLMRGVFYEQLMADKKAQIETDIIKQFNEKGMYLPDDSKEFPFDISKPKTSGSNENPVAKIAAEKELQFSPMLKTMLQDLK